MELIQTNRSFLLVIDGYLYTKVNEKVSLYAFFTELQKEQSDTESMIREMDLGKRIKKGRSRQQDILNERIRNLVLQYEEKKENILQYLLSVGHLIQL